MKLDLNSYSINRPYIQSYYKENKHRYKNISELLSSVAVGTHCPLIVLAHFLAEDIGYIPELNDLIVRLTLFYRYTEIKNQKEGSPYIKSSSDDIVE